MRYLPSGPEEQQELLQALGAECFTDLLTGVPEHLRMEGPPDTGAGMSEMEVRAVLERLAARNRSRSEAVCFAGAGAYDHFIPAAIDTIVSRSEFTTAYTPYQSEVSQGTLQVIYEFQSLVAELMGLEVANASLYDGAHAVAEAMLLAHATRGVPRVLVSAGLHPHARRVLDTYAAGLGIEVVTVPLGGDGRTDAEVLSGLLAEPASAVIFAHPTVYGCLEDPERVARLVHGADERKPPLVIGSVYPISLGVLAPPGEWGADVAAAEGQSLGLPLSFGGPFLGLFACREEFIRRVPGRLIGRTLDRDGRESFVLTLQTREQHIRRERATSNICTNQGLCATWATVYMTLLGPAGLSEVARQCHARAHYLAGELTALPGVALTWPDTPFFNEFTLTLPVAAGTLLERLDTAGFLGGVDPRRFAPEAPGDLIIAVTERRTRAELDAFIAAFETALAGGVQP